ncbi:FAD/NAD(P)-binding protein [Aeromicrobium duanguangcaii]|uniref:FAD/NAD(P)-binding protein n=1 Tax=Aeromicrobium duanguangcaii TaxID=2968086 RepID=A0ABY5KG77_9ACTN|nr:FAD/NAD(P)-binding protein [Aeromicrobium duanguangcaii]MCD9153428.1 FAD/NAD(P)-binding protein [Aeromicrobium duanguangcaii]UUI69481.1 FAD/NAD(P)-binding protein [Aeromicrobium duanguangcaii]
MNTPSARPTVVVVGGGAAGSLAALHLAREATDGVDLVVIDPAEDLGTGTAFGTTDPTHLLNVPASGMSALPDDPGHFARWRAATTGDEVDPHEFAPRAAWGRYLADTLSSALADAGSRVTLRHVRRRAVGVEHDTHGVTVTLDDDSTVTGQALVIGTGLPVPSVAWAPPALRDSERFLPDPWAPGMLERVRHDVASLPDVLVVGTGLTMVDIVSTVTTNARSDRFVHAVSRSGELPRRHADGPQAPAVPDISEWGHALDAIVSHVRAHLTSAERLTGDWRPGVDGLRHLVQDLWGRLDEADRVTFLRDHAGEWNRVRHRIPSPSARRIDDLHVGGRLATYAAQVTDAEVLDNGLRVHLSDGSVRDVGWVVNATGPDTDVRNLHDPLLDDLLRPRPDGSLAVTATAGMGFRTRGGRLVGSSGHPQAPIWVLGALRRGELWESTAVPDIRNQALATAEAVLSASTSGAVTEDVTP